VSKATQSNQLVGRTLGASAPARGIGDEQSTLADLRQDLVVDAPVVVREVDPEGRVRQLAELRR